MLKQYRFDQTFKEIQYFFDLFFFEKIPHIKNFHITRVDEEVVAILGDKNIYFS
jgi:hypothetical protein